MILLTNTTPSAPSKVAAPFSFDVAATPPRLRRGTRTPTPQHDETPCKPQMSPDQSRASSLRPVLRILRLHFHAGWHVGTGRCRQFFESLLNTYALSLC
jgi:hypothetical protein